MVVVVVLPALAIQVAVAVAVAQYQLVMVVLQVVLVVVGCSIHSPSQEEAQDLEGPAEVVILIGELVRMV
jgi:hypothetical protein